MRTLKPLALLCLFLAACLSAQAPAPVKIKIRAALFDRDLNLKPVPRLAITLKNLDASVEPISLQTTLDGIAETELLPGKYQLSTAKPAELFGKAYVWDLEVKIAKPDQIIELSNDNAKVTDAAGGRGAHIDELVEQYKRVKGSVVTVWTENGAGDGFVIDPRGLILTAYRTVNGRKWITVECSESVRLTAAVVSDDQYADVAILRINPENWKDIYAAPIAFDASALVEGERVFVVDNNLRKGKSMHVGVVSKADDKSINADAKATDVGSPLFNSSGSVVGYTRLVSKELHTVPIKVVKEEIETAQKTAFEKPAPAARLLPAPPPGRYPSAPLIARHETRWDKETYSFNLGDFSVEFVTPVSLYQATQENYAQEQAARRKHGSAGDPPLLEPEHDYEPVLVVSVTPQYKVPFWANMARTAFEPVIVRPKSSFGKLRLMCGTSEVEPIRPGRASTGTGTNGRVRVDTNSMEGRYTYHPDAISPKCGQVTVEVYPTDVQVPLTRALTPAVVERLSKDFDAYRSAQAKSAPSAGAN